MLESKHFCLFDIKINGSVVVQEVFVMLLQLSDEITVKGIKTHLDIWQLTHWKLFNPSQDLLELSNCDVFLFLSEVWIDIEETVHSFVLLCSGLDSVFDLWELLAIFSDDGNTFLRVLPVLSDMLGTSSMLIVLKFIIDIV